MEDIVKFCDKTIAKNKVEIMNCERILKSSLEKKEFLEIEQTIKTNEEGPRSILQQLKFKKFQNLKHNPPKKPTTTNDVPIEQPKRSYLSAVKDNVISPQK